MIMFKKPYLLTLFLFSAQFVTINCINRPNEGVIIVAPKNLSESDKVLFWGSLDKFFTLRENLSTCEEALKHLDIAIGLSGNDSCLWCMRGYVNFSIKKFSEAIRDFDAAIHINFRNADAHLGRGASNLGLGYQGPAIADFQIAAKLGSSMARDFLLRYYGN